MVEGVVLFVFGISIGSFLNVLIDRLPNDESIGGRSHCDYCGKTLKSTDLVPIFSFVALNGKSSCCKKPLSVQYPLIELLTGFIFVFVGFFTWPHVVLTLSLLGIAAALIVVVIADLKYHIIPDAMVLTLIIFTLGFIYMPIGYVEILMQHFAAGLILFIAMLLLFIMTKGKGLGFGDVKLAFAVGFLLGLKAGFLALYFAFMTGGVIGLFLILFQKKGLKTKIAFGPFMVLGIVIMLLWGEKVLRFASEYFI